MIFDTAALTNFWSELSSYAFEKWIFYTSDRFLQVDRNERLLWFWATWEAAQFCIQSKLRTPLGKPQETFTAIEGVIKKYTTELRNHEAANGNQKGYLNWNSVELLQKKLFRGASPLKFLQKRHKE